MKDWTETLESSKNGALLSSSGHKETTENTHTQHKKENSEPNIQRGEQLLLLVEKGAIVYPVKKKKLSTLSSPLILR